MIYELIFDREFKKDLSNIDKEMRNRILRKIFELEKYPEWESILLEQISGV